VSTAVAQARRVTRDLTRHHDENFPVAFALLPRDLRADMRAVYAFCRTVDDLGDTGPVEDRLAALDGFERDLHRCWDGQPEDARLAALAVTVRRHAMDPDPFLHLLDANRMDQRQNRWQTYEDLLDYCRHSAAPVGQMVLAVLGHRDLARITLSDHTCIGLQLVNFWQDIARDLADNDRIYLPVQDMQRFGVDEAALRSGVADEPTRTLIAFEIARARAELIAGAPLAGMVRTRARLDLRMFTAGGLALCDAIARQGYDTLARRPAPGTLGRARIAADVIIGLFRGSR
jgi:squalene synthase HpnC